MKINYKFLITLFSIIILIGTCFASASKKDNNEDNKITKFKEELLNKNIQFLMKFGNIPSISTCIIQNNQTFWDNSYGFYDIKNHKSSTKNTIYHAASIAKSITATAAMQLYEKNLFKLDDDINDYLPFQIHHPQYPDITITFRMLMSHTAGLKEAPFNVQIEMIEYNQDPPSISSWIKNYFYTNDTLNEELWLDNKPGTKYSYANEDFFLIAYIVEILTEKSFNTYCKENIFIPLDMTNTSFYLSEINQSNIAIEYIYFDDYKLPIDFYSWAMYPSGNLYTTIEDLSHFVIANMNNGIYKDIRILNSSTINLMHTIQTPKNLKNKNYGLGFQIWDKLLKKNDCYGHYGSMLGTYSQIKIKTYENTGLIYLLTVNVNRGIKEKISLYLIEKIISILL